MQCDKRRVSAVLVLALLCAAGPAAAIDLTGSWNLSGKCKGFLGTQVIKSGVDDIVVNVTQSGTGLNVSAGGLAMSGVVAADSVDPDRAAVTLATCGITSDFTTLPVVNQLLNLSAKTGSGGKGTMRGRAFELSINDGGANGQSCTYKMKRTSVVDPVVAACP